MKLHGWQFSLGMALLLSSASLRAEVDHTRPNAEENPGASSVRPSGDQEPTRHPIDDSRLAPARTQLEVMRKNSENQIDGFVALSIQDLLRGLDKGGLHEKLKVIITGGEDFTDKEKNATFLKKGETLNELEKLNPKEREEISVEYTLIRKKLREQFLDALAKKLITKEKEDPRLADLANAIELVKEANLGAYDKAVARIKQQRMERPICFTCGEPVGPDDAEPPWEYFEALGKAATEALVKLELDNESGRGPFANNKYYRTSAGTIIPKDRVGLRDDGELEARATATDPHGVLRGKDPFLINHNRELWFASTKQNGGEWDPNVSKEMKLKVNAFLRKTDPGTPYMKEIESTKLAAPSSIPNSTGGHHTPGTDPKTEVVKNYLESLGGDAPSFLAFPVPENLAAVLGLKYTTPTGEASYLKYKGKNSYLLPGHEFGVEVDWKAIDVADLAEKNRAMAILWDIYQGDVHSYKVANDKYISATESSRDGYCVYCNLTNNAESVKRMKAYEKTLPAK